MKITLRKVRSVKIGENFKPDLFIPLKLPKKISAVSISVMGISYSICPHYGIDYKEYEEVCYKIYRKRQVFEFNKGISFIFVPSTKSSNSKSIKQYCEKICDLVEFKDYLHFTHFGYLKTSFPKDQIKTILEFFIEKDIFECEVCWDIDEKFFVEMRQLLEECLVAKNNDIAIDSYDADDFKWCSKYDAWRLSRSEERDKRRLVHSVRISEEYAKTCEAAERISQFRRDDLVTRNIDNLPTIGAVAAGNAGEYYALSLFIRMGFVAGKAPAGTSAYDLLVMSQDGLFFKPIQVKTITNGQHWLLKQRHEEIIDNLIFCFIKLTNISSIPKVYLIPADVVSFVITMCHEIYESPEQFLNENQLSFIRNYSFGWLDAYEDNFDIFNGLN